MNELVASLYQPEIESARARFAAHPALVAIMSPDVAPARLELFLIHFCAYGVAMTEPVDGWIRRAGERCRAIGMQKLGDALVKHAKHEAGHHLMMEKDTRVLVKRWNARAKSPLDADALFAAAKTPGVAAYVKLHEDVIASETPYGQLAIEYEIEGLSVRVGGGLLKHCAERIGPEVLEGLSFLEEHVAVDVGHTKFNEAELQRVLAEDRSRLPALVRAGRGALDAYAEFVKDCLAAADAALP